MEYEAKKVFLVNIAFMLTVGGIVYFVSKFMLTYLFPFLIAAVAAFLLHKPAELLHRRTRISAAFWRCALILAVYFAVTAAVVFSATAAVKYSKGLYNELNSGFKTAGELFKRLSGAADSLIASLPDDIKETAQNVFSDFADKSASAVAQALSSYAAYTAKFLPYFLLSTAVTLVASFYIAKDYSRLVLFLKNFVGKKRYAVICEIKEISVGSVCRLGVGYLIIAAITFLEVLTGLLLWSVKYAPIIAFLIAIVDLLPVLGSGTVLVPWSVLCLLNGNTARGVGLAVLYVAITVIRNFIEPKIIGKKLNVNPLFMLIAIFVGLRVGGFAGMIVLPITFIVIISYYKNQAEKGE